MTSDLALTANSHQEKNKKQTKKRGNLATGTACMNPEVIVLSEMSDEKDKYCVISLICRT